MKLEQLSHLTGGPGFSHWAENTPFSKESKTFISKIPARCLSNETLNWVPLSLYQCLMLSKRSYRLGKFQSSWVARTCLRGLYFLYLPYLTFIHPRLIQLWLSEICKSFKSINSLSLGYACLRTHIVAMLRSPLEPTSAKSPRLRGA